MKSAYWLVGCLLFLMSCDASPEITDETNDTPENLEESVETLISKRWIYKEKTKSDGEDRFSYEDGGSDVILRLDQNGFFMIYDSITDPKLIEQGVRRIEQRSAGQWELVKNDLLLLRKIFNDTIIIDSLIIQEVDKDKLVTETSDKAKRTYFSVK